MNHREIDERVAECLGWDIYNESYDGWYVWRKSDGSTVVDKLAEPFTFFSGDGMLLLIEEARKQGVLIDIETWHDRFEGKAVDATVIMKKVEATTAPMAASLVFLKVKGVDITPYLEEVNVGCGLTS
jgi:hypothetical protein